MIDVVLGLQRGDEGKGRFVDLLAADYDVVARFNGGPNAGHTIAHDRLELRLHQVPSGITRPGITNLIGNGSYVDPLKLLAEIADIQTAGLEVSPERLVVSTDAHLILPHHIDLDEIREAGKERQGSTLSGIAYVAADKYARRGVRAENLLDKPQALARIVTERLDKTQQLLKAAGLPAQDVSKITEQWLTAAEALRPYIGDTFSILHAALDRNKPILAEGAQATGLDIEHGMYPFVTSSHTTTGSVLNGLGVGPKHVRRIIGVAKVLRSHVGGGPFVTKEADSKKASLIRGKKGHVDSEYGATTGRERQVGYLDLPELKRAILVNGVTELVLTKLDTLSRLQDTIPVAVAYQYRKDRLTVPPSSAVKLDDCQPIYEQLPSWDDDISGVKSYDALPQNARDFVSFVEAQLELPVTMIGTGPQRDQVIFR